MVHTWLSSIDVVDRRSSNDFLDLEAPFLFPELFQGCFRCFTLGSFNFWKVECSQCCCSQLFAQKLLSKDGCLFACLLCVSDSDITKLHFRCGAFDIWSIREDLFLSGLPSFTVVAIVTIWLFVIILLKNHFQRILLPPSTLCYQIRDRMSWLAGRILLHRNKFFKATSSQSRFVWLQLEIVIQNFIYLFNLKRSALLWLE